MNYARFCMLLSAVAVFQVIRNIPRMSGEQSVGTTNALFSVTVWTIIAIYSTAVVWEQWAQ